MRFVLIVSAFFLMFAVSGYAAEPTEKGCPDCICDCGCPDCQGGCCGGGCCDSCDCGNQAQQQSGQWVCVARTPVLQKAFTGCGETRALAKKDALEKCQKNALFGCYIASCQH